MAGFIERVADIDLEQVPRAQGPGESEFIVAEMQIVSRQFPGFFRGLPALMNQVADQKLHLKPERNGGTKRVALNPQPTLWIMEGVEIVRGVTRNVNVQLIETISLVFGGHPVGRYRGTLGLYRSRST